MLLSHTIAYSADAYKYLQLIIIASPESIWFLFVTLSLNFMYTTQAARHCRVSVMILKLNQPKQSINRKLTKI